jgi:hypothetical protein
MQRPALRSEPRVSLSKSCFRRSSGKSPKWLEARWASWARPASVSSASSRWPLRMRFSCPAAGVPREAISQACSNSTGRWRENTGVRRAAARQALDFLAQVGLEGGQADAGLARRHHEVAVRLLQQGQEQVFDVDLVLAEADADPGRARGGRPGGVVQLADQGLQVDVHRGLQKRPRHEAAESAQAASALKLRCGGIRRSCWWPGPSRPRYCRRRRRRFSAGCTSTSPWRTSGPRSRSGSCLPRLPA